MLFRSPVDPGSYQCEVILTVGEFHYVAADVETSYEGFRLFSLDSSLQQTGLDMYWNDAEVQANPRARSARLRVLERMPRS